MPFTASKRRAPRGRGGRRRRRSRIESSRCLAVRTSVICSFGSSASRSAVGQERERGHEDRHGRRRGGTSCHQLPRISSLCASASIVPQETWSTGTPKPEVRQDHLGLDEAHDEQRQLHQDTWLTLGRMWRNMRDRFDGADRLGGAHVLAVRVLDELGAHQAVDAGPAGQRRGSARSAGSPCRTCPRPSTAANAKISRMYGIEVKTL